MIATMPSELLKSTARDRAVALLGHYETLAKFAIEVWEATCRETLRTGDAEPLHAQRDQCEFFLKANSSGSTIASGLWHPAKIAKRSKAMRG